MNGEAIEIIKNILDELIDVVEIIEKRTVEKPSDNFNITPVKKQIYEIKYQIKRL